MVDETEDDTSDDLPCVNWGILAKLVRLGPGWGWFEGLGWILTSPGGLAGPGGAGPKL